LDSGGILGGLLAPFGGKHQYAIVGDALPLRTWKLADWFRYTDNRSAGVRSTIGEKFAAQSPLGGKLMRGKVRADVGYH
jgi:hypothetical protein